MKRTLCNMLIISAFAVLSATAQDLQNLAQTTYGTRAISSGAPFNKDWPASRTIRPEGKRRGGAIFGNPMEGGRIDIILPFEVMVTEIQLIPLDYRGTSTPKNCDIYVDGKKFTSVEVPDSFKPFSVEINRNATEIGVVTKSIYEKKVLWGGWNRIRVMSPFDMASAQLPIDEYNVPVTNSNIAVKEVAASDRIVYGKPRISKGHPCTIWDKEDIAHYKKMMKTSPLLKNQFDSLKRAMDERITQPINVPQPQKNDKGEWIHISDTKVGKIHNLLALDVANLGALYALSDDPKYAEFAKKILLEYADAYPNYGVGARPGFNHDPSKVFDQRLGDATWLIQIARGYDLIYNLPTITPEERKHIEDDLIKASGRFIAANTSVIRSPTNWSAISTTAVLIAGVATDDEWLFNRAMYGINSDKNPSKWWEGSPNKSPSGIELHFSDRTIDVDGMWAEGAMGYQFMALQALITNAEILWHKGIDMYGYRDAALKSLFDSPLKYAYPDLKSPAVNDSGSASIIGRDAYLYEFAYRRYKDPTYIPILQRVSKRLSAAFQQWPVSVLYDVDLSQNVEFAEPESVNMNGVGFGIIRINDKSGTQSLLMDYGPNRSHGHPDKLNIDLWSKGIRLLPDPGTIWYEQPLYRRWYRTTMAHNTLSVNNLSQQGAGAELISYLPAKTFGFQRASTSKAYPGVVMDRSVFITANYLADIFGAFSRLPKLYDLCWHVVGEFSSDLKFKPFEFSAPVENGYNELANPRAVKIKSNYKTDYAYENRKSTLHSSPTEPTTVIAGEGHLGKSRPTAILQRRNTENTIYGNVLDIADNEYVKSIETIGSVKDGYALLTIQTVDGTDLCFAAYSNKTYKLKELETDSLQAMVTTKDGSIKSMAITGGTYLYTRNGSISRKESGIIYLEKLDNGSYVVGNPSNNETEVTITLPDIKEYMHSYICDSKGKRIKKHSLINSENKVTFTLPALSRVELTQPNTESIFEYQQKILRKKAEAELLKIEQINALIKNRYKEREAAAQENPVPENTIIVVQAEDFTGEDGGQVALTSKKFATIGSSLLKWNANGHWLEWKVNVEKEGYYNFSFLYCAESETKRQLLINGESPDLDITENIVLKSTGGWANSSDDWFLYTIQNPISEKPLLVYFKQGENIIKMENTSGGGANMDYLLITSPDVKPERLK